MTTIKQEDFISSIADAFQYISYYHPVDYIKALHEAYLKEESPAAKDAMAQILINSRMAAEGTGRSARTPASPLPSYASAWTFAGTPGCHLSSWSMKA